MVRIRNRPRVIQRPARHAPDVPPVIKTVLSTAQIQRTSIFSLLLANHGSLTTSQITEYLNISKPTALRTMAEIKAVGLVDEDEVMVGPNSVKRVTLRHEFDWFLSEEFAELNEDFRPVDYSEFLWTYSLLSTKLD
jgi:predicted transcriptional regulator